MDGWMDGLVVVRGGHHHSRSMLMMAVLVAQIHLLVLLRSANLLLRPEEGPPQQAGTFMLCCCCVELATVQREQLEDKSDQIRSLHRCFFCFSLLATLLFPPLTTAFPIHFGCSLTPSHLITMMPKCEIKRIYCTIYTNWSIPSALKRGSGMGLLLGKEMGECDGIREGLLRWMDDG